MSKKKDDDEVAVVWSFDELDRIIDSVHGFM